MEIFFSPAVVSNQRGCSTLSECIVGVLAALCSMLKGDIEKPSYYHLQGDVQASRCVYYVPYMQLLSVDFSFKAVWLLTVHQVLISGARDEPSSNHIRHGEAITAGPFLVMVYSPNDKPTGCVGSGHVCLPFLHRGTSPRYTDRDGWRQRVSQTHQAHSSVTVTTQCITAAPLHYQHAPCWEIYLRTVILSAKQLGTGTHRWLILSRRGLGYHCPVTDMCYSNSLLSHRSIWSIMERAGKLRLIISPA